MLNTTTTLHVTNNNVCDVNIWGGQMHIYNMASTKPWTSRTQPEVCVRHQDFQDINQSLTFVHIETHATFESSIFYIHT